MKIPTHETVYRRLRDMILFGELTPGQPVTIQGLVAELETGMTPVREAIRRLTAEGALEFQGNRRVCVPEMTARQLEELSFARLAIEPRLALLGAETLSAHDIKQLEAIDTRLNQAIDKGDVYNYLLNNYNFHFFLYEKSGATILLSLANTLWLRAGPSLRVICGRFGTYSLPDKHLLALDAMRQGNSEAVAKAIEEDLRQGAEQISKSLHKFDL